jgi:hypothetical protein
MDTNKSHRFLTETETLAIFETTDAELSAAEGKFEDIVERVFDGAMEPGALAQLVRDKKLTASTVRIGEQPAFVLIHTRNSLGWLIIEGAASIGRAPLKVLFDGGEALARHFGAPVVLFVTKLRALYRYGRQRDYNPVGVILCKGVPA